MAGNYTLVNSAAQIDAAIQAAFNSISGTTWVGDPIGAIYLPSASTAAEGIVELATNAETQLGASAALAVTPAGLSATLVDFAAALTVDWAQITNAPSGLTWSEVISASHAAVVNEGYIINSASLITVTLPSTANVGDRLAITGSGPGGWRLSQNSGQQIHFDDMSTQAGTGGYLSSSFRYNCVEIQCVVTNTTWIVRSSVGDINVI